MAVLWRRLPSSWFIFERAVIAGIVKKPRAKKTPRLEKKREHFAQEYFLPVLWTVLNIHVWHDAGAQPPGNPANTDRHDRSLLDKSNGETRASLLLSMS